MCLSSQHLISKTIWIKELGTPFACFFAIIHSFEIKRSFMKNYLPITNPKGFIFRMLIILFMMVITADHSFSQQRNGYLGLEAGVYIVKPENSGVGAHFSGNAEIANDMFLGAEIGAVKLHRLDNVYLPLLARFSMMPALRSGKARLLVVLAPGYGFYDDSYRIGGINYKSKGGFAFYGGVGAAFKGKQRGYLTVTAGYSTFGFSTNGYKSNIDGVGIRFGGLFR
jgi:hypothetical protein